ncbi:MAG: VWA domain-containing protein [Microcystis aeruginosa G13-07]|nr:VWA domain-containing protein [Microcystis aeruginosa G13-07]
MSFGLPEPEFIDNPENRCPVILLLDTSSSMYGDPITELNQGVKILKASIMEDELAALRVEVAVITFDSEVKVVQNFITIDQFIPQKLIASGGTRMGQAIEKALNLLEERKATYRKNDIQYYRPWIFLITDGSPTDTWQDAAKRLREAEAKGKLLFFAVGVQEADMETLSEIAPLESPPKQLKGLEFQSLFKWLSASMKQVSAGKIGEKKTPPTTSGWEEIIS